MIPFPLVTAEQNFAQTATDHMVNWYGEKIGNGKSAKWVLRCSPGSNLFGVCPGTNAIRPGGLHQFLALTEILFAVRGNSFQEWTGTEFVERGKIGTFTGSVDISNNGVQVFISDGIKGYGYDPTDATSFAEVEFNGGTGAVFSSLRIVSAQPNSGFFWCSAQDDVYTWSGTAGADTESYPDPIIGIASLGQVLFLIGSNSYEVWIDQGYLDFPFRRVQAGSNIGCSAKGSICIFGGSVFWLGGSAEGKGIVYQTSGYTPNPISDNRIDEIIEGISDLSDAVGYVYQEEGHVFYVLTFGIGNKTLVYDVTTQLWAVRDWRDPISGVHSRSLIIAQCVYQGMNLGGDFRNGNVYEVSRKFHTDNGAPIIRDKIFPIWPDDSYEFTSMPPFVVGLDVGQANSGDEAPKMIMTYLENRGESQSIEYYRELGRQGRYNLRVVFNGQGSSFGRAYRVRLVGNQDFVMRSAGLLNGQ